MSVAAPRWVLILGWIFALLGGLIGIFVGAHLRFAKITAPSGEKVARYDNGSRTQGLIILILGVVMLIGWNVVGAAMR